jgi:glycosyltransferase involved in cell wall biosynthesis
MDNVHLMGWMPGDEFQLAVAAADVFVHPARFDAFGGGTLFAMAAGTPLIGSLGAGAVVERVRNGHNGLTYDAEDIGALAGHLAALAEDESLRKRIGPEGRSTAEMWPPEKGVEILLSSIGGALPYVLQEHNH